MKMNFSLAVVALLTTILCGCGSRNIYKRSELNNPPLSRGYVHMTGVAANPNPQNQTQEAGVEPVEFASPLATSDTVYVASETRGIEALERPTFRRKWNFNVKNGVSSALALSDGVLYFGSNDGNFYALNAEFGRVLWKFETKVSVFARPFISDNRVYFTASDDVVYCLEKDTGKWVWHYKRGGDYITTVRGNSAPTLSDGRIYVGFSDGYIVALDSKDGNLKWEQKIHKGTKFTDVDASALIDGDRIYVPSYDGELYALTTQAGKIVWHIDVGGSKRVVMNDKTLYMGTSNGRVISINKDTGRIGWTFELDQGTPTNLVLHENYLAFGSSQQYFYAIHSGDGTLAYRYNAGLRSGFFSTPTQTGTDIFILSNFGNLYEFKWSGAQRKTRVN